MPIKKGEAGGRKGLLLNQLAKLLFWEPSQRVRQCFNETQIERGGT